MAASGAGAAGGSASGGADAAQARKAMQSMNDAAAPEAEIDEGKVMKELQGLLAEVHAAEAQQKIL